MIGPVDLNLLAVIIAARRFSLWLDVIVANVKVKQWRAESSASTT
jgi:hypothetical protein